MPLTRPMGGLTESSSCALWASQVLWVRGERRFSRGKRTGGATTSLVTIPDLRLAFFGGPAPTNRSGRLVRRRSTKMRAGTELWLQLSGRCHLEIGPVRRR
jgi:hypothetical protein